MIRINRERLWQRLMTMAEIGATEKGGVKRLALTDQDKQGRDLFVRWCEEAGCTIQVDGMGNIFAIRVGKSPESKVVLAGSHLDSQPTGGKYDGVLGVLAALEVVECLNENEIETERSLVIVSWTNEEGARFNPAMIASGVFAGVFDQKFAYGLLDPDGKSIGEELKRIGYQGSYNMVPNQIHAAVELHIEQGPILEKKEQDIGIVGGVQGIRWYNLHCHGQEMHAGPFPMSLRKDPMKMAVHLASEIYRFEDRFGSETRTTIGFIHSNPQVKNTVPGQCTLSLDLRHPEEEKLKAMHQEVQKMVEQANQSGLRVELEDLWYSAPVVFHKQVIEAIDSANKKLGYKAMPITSGAGHDSVYLSKVCPTGMIFIPCEDGLSHNEAESISPKQAEAGANVLLHTLLELTGI